MTPIMKKIILSTLALSLCLGTLSSCVSNKKFKSAQSSIAGLRNQNRNLTDELSSTKSRLQLMEEANKSAADQINQKNQAIAENSKQLEASSMELQAQQEKLRQLQALIDQQQEQTEALRKKMADALGGFTSEQLSVFTKNGKVYVSLSEKLLFPSGSAVVNTEGEDALQKVAEALIQNPEINVNIEGHTDTVPIKGRFQDNWDLSVGRATAVLRLLTQKFDVNPIRFTASGRGQYEPVADNATGEGRARNRRTEIILAPKLDELMQLIEGGASK